MPMISPDKPPMVTALNVDLSNCDKEQIQFCGAIQSHGALIAIEEGGWTITQVSANSEALLGMGPEQMLGQPLHHLLGTEQVEQLRRAVGQRPSLTCPPVCLLTDRLPGRSDSLHIFAHRNDDGVLIFEFESESRERPESLRDLYSDVRSSIAELEGTNTVQAFFDLAVSRIRRFTGYDRVLAYKFLEDGSGWVLAEDREPGLDSYVGLHYPASDIPEPARRLFSKKWISHLPDVDYRPVPLVSFEKPGAKPLDLSYSFLRSVSVMYSGYLKNMGVHSSMVLTLVKHGKLWGLISCMHHRGTKHVPYEARMAAEFLAHLLSLAMASKEELEDRDHVGRMKNLQAKLMEYMLQQVTFQEGLLRYDPNLLSYFGATGAVVWVDGRLQTLGETPDDQAVQALLGWLADRMGSEPFSTDRLMSLYPPAASFKAAGLLAVRLFVHKPHFIVWFRPEVERTVNWAGDPHKPVEVSKSDGEERLLPRTSFALWKESVKGGSKPWRESELAAAADLRRIIIEVVLRKAEELTRKNEELTRSNADLEAFAHIASHDLKEPLRGIHNYASFVLEDYADKLDEEGQSKLRTMMKLTERMDQLIDGILHYSRLGREKLETEPTDLNHVVNLVIETLRPRLDQLGVTVRVPAPLPSVTINPVMLQEVFANLITNAMKYNDKPEKWIEIGSLTHADLSVQAAEELALGRRVIYVKDNGIGIPEKFSHTIFQIFRRLHGRDQYGGGTGMGLTIVKVIVERHGGRIWLDSEPGRGTTFFMALPGG